MYLVFLRFSHDKSQAAAHMTAHKAWIDHGIAAGQLLLVGSLAPGLGGFVIARGLSRTELDTTLAADPFVAHGVVTTEVFELSPQKADPRLAFLLA